MYIMHTNVSYTIHQQARFNEASPYKVQDPYMILEYKAIKFQNEATGLTFGLHPHPSQHTSVDPTV